MQDFCFRIQTMQQRVRALYRDAYAAPRKPDLLLRAFEELQHALEELQTAEGTLQRQREQFADQQQHGETERQEYQQLFEYAPDAYLITSRDGTIRKVNQAARMLFNTDEKAMLGRPLAGFVPEGERRTFRTKLNLLQTTARTEDCILRLQQHHGSSFTASATVARVCDGKGRPIALRWQLRNVTRDADHYQHHIYELEQRIQDLERQISAGQSQALTVQSPDTQIIEARHAFLAEALVLLTFATERDVLTHVASLAVPAFADLCIVDCSTDDPQMERLAVVASPAQQSFAQELSRSAAAARVVPAMTHVLCADSDRLYHPTLTTLLGAVACDARQVQAIHTLAPTAALIVPIQCGERAFGQWVFVSTTQGQRYNQYDQALAEMLARRAGLLLDRLTRQHERAREVGMSLL